MFIQALKPTELVMQWEHGALSPGVKSRGRETDHSAPSIAEVKNSGAVRHVPQFLPGVVLSLLSTELTLSFYHFIIMSCCVLSGVCTHLPFQVTKKLSVFQLCWFNSCDQHTLYSEHVT
jgi:hypothetical protein